MIKIGDKAPNFELLDIIGKKIILSYYKEETIILYFYPKDSTPGCTAEACSFRDNFDIYKKKGYIVFGISMDDQKSHKKFTEKYNLPFTLLCDTTGEICKKYEAYGKKKFMGREYMGIIRKTYIIQKQKITHIIDEVKCPTHAEDIIKLLGQ